MAAAVVIMLLGVAAAARGAAMPDAQPNVTITHQDYRGWPNTYRLSNGRIEAEVVTAIGPRIIELKSVGGKNLFHVRDAEAGGSGEPKWMFRGGWRLWIAPERRETTYALDNAPCAEFLEVPNLSPLTAIPPGGEIVYPEDWWVFRDVTVPNDEAGALRALQRYVERTAPVAMP